MEPLDQLEQLMEQAPRYTLTSLDDGHQEKIHLVIYLPGVISASELEVQIHERAVHLRVPGRYRLDLPLSSPVDELLHTLRFVKKKAVLKAELLVKPRAAHREAGSAGDSSSGAAGSPFEGWAQHLAAGGPTARPSPAASRPSVHNSFLEDAIRLAGGKLAAQAAGSGKKSAARARTSSQQEGAAQPPNPSLASGQDASSATQSRASKHPKTASALPDEQQAEPEEATLAPLEAPAGDGPYAEAAAAKPLANGNGHVATAERQGSGSSIRRGFFDPPPKAKQSPPRSAGVTVTDPAEPLDSIGEDRRTEQDGLGTAGDVTSTEDADRSAARPADAPATPVVGERSVKAGPGDDSGSADDTGWAAAGSHDTSPDAESSGLGEAGSSPVSGSRAGAADETATEGEGQGGRAGAESAGAEVLRGEKAEASREDGPEREDGLGGSPRVAAPEEAGPGGAGASPRHKPAAPQPMKPSNRQHPSHGAAASSGTGKHGGKGGKGKGGAGAKGSGGADGAGPRQNGFHGPRGNGHERAPQAEAEKEKKEDIYAEGVRRAQKEAAEQFLRKAQEAMAAEDWDRAVRFLSKANSLQPGQYAEQLKRAHLRRERSGFRSSQAAAESPPSSPTSSAGDPADGHSAFAEGATPGLFGVLFGWQLPAWLTVALRVLHRAWWMPPTMVLAMASFWGLLRQSSVENLLLRPGLSRNGALAGIWAGILYVAYLLLPWCAWLGLGTARLLLWSPPWWSAAALAITIALQSSLWRIFWPFPIMWWAVGGGWWALLGTPAALFAWYHHGTSFAALFATYVTRATWASMPWWGAACLQVVIVVAWLMLGETTFHIPGDGAGSGDGKWGTGSSGAHLKHEVPAGAEGEVARVLAATDYFQVLGIERTAGDEEVKKAKRQKSLATHPDKLGAGTVGANEAIRVVTQAAEILSDPAKRREYLAELEAADRAPPHRSDSGGSNGAYGPAAAPSSNRPSSYPGGVGFYPDAVSLHVPCERCGRAHAVEPTDIPRQAARFCREHGTRHEASEGQGWLETTPGLFGTTYVFMCYQGIIYDITDWATCGGIIYDPDTGGRYPANTHLPPLKFSLPGPGGGGGGRAGGGRANRGGGGGGKKGRHKRR